MAILNFAASLAVFVWLASALFWGIASLAVAATFKLTKLWLWLLIGAIVPVIGLLVALLVGLTKREPGRSTKTKVGNAAYRLWFGLACWVLILVFVFSYFMPWFAVVDASGPLYNLRGWSSGLDTWLWATVGTLAVCAIVNVFKPNRFIAVAMAWFGSWWLLYSLAALISGKAFHEAADGLFNITDMVLKDAESPILVGHDHWNFTAGFAWYFVLLGSLGLLAQCAWVLRVCSKATVVQVEEIDFWGTSSSGEDFLTLI